MPDRSRLAIIVGAFVLASLAALALVIVSLSSQERPFADRYRLVAYFDNVQGLIANAPVWLAGTQVGRVESVTLSAREGGEPAVEVRLRIDTSVAPRIRADSTASIGTIGLLGDRYVEVSLGSPDARVLSGGDEIRAIDPVNISAVIDSGASALDNISSLTGNLNSVLAEFETSEGGAKLARSVGSVGDIVTQIQDGEGLLHSLIYDEYEGGGVESIESSLATLEGILKEIAHGEGLLHSLIYEEVTDQEVVAEALDVGSRLNKILAKLDEGEGTFGLLLNDPTLYEDLKRLVGGAQRSAVVRTLIRMSADAEEE